MDSLKEAKNIICMRLAFRELGKPKIMDDMAKYSAMVLSYGADLIELELIELEMERNKNGYIVFNKPTF